MWLWLWLLSNSWWSLETVSFCQTPLFDQDNKQPYVRWRSKQRKDHVDEVRILLVPRSISRLVRTVRLATGEIDRVCRRQRSSVTLCDTALVQGKFLWIFYRINNIYVGFVGIICRRASVAITVSSSLNMSCYVFAFQPRWTLECTSVMRRRGACSCKK